MTRTLLTYVLASLLATANLAADEVVLKDGRTYVGKTKKVGKFYIITTLDEVVRVRVDEVQRVRTDDDLRDALEQMAMRSGAGSCHAQLELARMARRWGLSDEMWRYLSKVLRSTHHNSPVMQRRTREFMADLEREILPKKWRNARPKIKVRELLYRIKNKIPKAKLAAVEELLIHVAQADKYLRQRARRVTNSLQRGAAIRAIGHRSAKGNDRFLYRTAILDRSSQVRKKAMEVTKELGKSKAAIEYLSPGLLHDNAKYRIRTAHAFGELGDAAALPLLVAAGPTAGMVRRDGLPGGATRAHMAVIKQIAYIRDFDVEVAQASFIADPKVDVLQSGVVLDVTVLAVTNHRVEIVDAYRNAIRKIVGVDPGRNPKKWAAWLAKLQPTNNRPATTPDRTKKG